MGEVDARKGMSLQIMTSDGAVTVLGRGSGGPNLDWFVSQETHNLNPEGGVGIGQSWRGDGVGDSQREWLPWWSFLQEELLVVLVEEPGRLEGSVQGLVRAAGVSV